MIDSQGKKRTVLLEDKPFSNVSNYSEKCNYQCYQGKKVDDNKIDDSTYKIEMSMDLVNDCIKGIKFIFFP